MNGAASREPAGGRPGNGFSDGLCGRCRTVLGKAEPAVLTAENFGALAEQSDIPLLVDFWAPWCGPCRQMAPAFAAATAQLEPAFRLAKLNIEAERSLAQRFGIQSIPTLMILHKGREIARQSGVMQTAAIVAFARKLFSEKLAGVQNAR